MLTCRLDFTPSIPSVLPDESSNFLHGFRHKNFYSGEIRGMEYLMALRERSGIYIKHQPISDLFILNPKGDHGLMEQIPFILEELQDLLKSIDDKKEIPVDRLHTIMHRSAAYVIAIPKPNADIIRYLVRIPIYLFTPESIEIGTAIWNWMLVERPEIENKLMIEMSGMWTWSQCHRKGIFSPLLK